MATGRAAVAFAFVVVSALAEPVAAVIAWLCLSQRLNPTLLGALFGVVAGIMTLVAFQELLPTARAFDAQDRVSTLALVAGMALMAASLAALEFTGAEGQ
jgi:ZIP family zinc transporter